MKKSYALLFGAVFACAAVPLALAGDLNPPAGPVAPTPGPEPRTAINATNTPGDADSLFRITTSGSYYLTGNITGVAAESGIEIAASGVTLDLMGFDLAGVAGSLDGVTATLLGTVNIAVVNGSVRDWDGDGVDLVSADNTRLADLRASGNAVSGIVAADNAVVTGCSAHMNGGDGIRVGSGCVITDCSAKQNGDDGIVASTWSTLRQCSVYANSDDGIESTFGGNSILDCTAGLNLGDGIQCNADDRVMNNSCDGNSQAGVHCLGSDNRIDGNLCTDNTRNIDVDAPGNLIIRNTSAGSVTGYDIVADNRYGPIINITATGTAAVSGNGGVASTAGSTDPWANFAY